MSSDITDRPEKEEAENNIVNASESQPQSTDIAKAEEAKKAILKASESEGNDFREEILSLIPDEADKQKAMVVMASYEEKYSGPIPHPKHLEAYENICPGLADRLVTMAEAQQSHRFDIENKAITEQVGSNKRGQWFAFILAILLVGVCVFVMVTVNSIVGIIMIAVVALGIFALYKDGKMSIAADLKNKRVSGEAKTKETKE